MILETLHHLIGRRIQAASAALPPVPLALLPLVLSVTLAACAPIPAGVIAGPTPLIPQPLFASPGTTEAAASTSPAAATRNERRLQTSDTPRIPDPSRVSTIKPGSPVPPAGEAAVTTLAFDQMPLPTFINIVFGTILKKSFSADPAVMTRSDLVTLRTGQPQTASQVFETTRLLLKSYGVAVNDLGSDVYRIVPDTNQAAYLPEIRRGRAQPDVPLPLRPVFNLVEMAVVKNTDVANWLKAMFGARLSIQEDASRNALLISGQAPEVTAGLEAIQVLDQPLMRGRSSQFVTPATLGADDLARRLVEILGTEGYAAGLGASNALPISFVPIPASNSLLVFAADPAVLAHVLAWANKLDSLENDNRRTGNYFSYEVKYADAQALAKTMQELMAAQASTVTESQQVSPGVRVIGATVQRQPGRIVVNAATNTLIFSTNNPDEYGQLLGIMKSLDRPVKSAMIEVTVAEVRLDDSSQLGIEWSFGDGNGGVNGGTLGGLGLGSGGLALSYLNSAGAVRSKLNALASDNRARILSTPRVMARNGEAATIQVGQEVPIVTSQQSTTTGTSTASTGVLQTIQYRSTGVILRVKPIIFAGRIELEVQQEVSSAASTSTGVNVSPTFSTRKVDTKLSIRDGATVALGGLISRTEATGATGVPILKDLPGLGQFFRTNTSSGVQTELIILITPYVIDNDMVAEQVTQAMRNQLGPWAQPSGPTPSPLIRPPVEVSRPSVPPTPAPESEGTTSQVKPEVSSSKTLGGDLVRSTPAAPADQAKPLAAAELAVPAGRVVQDPATLEAIRRATASSSAAGKRAVVVLPNKVAQEPGSAASSAKTNRP